MPKALFIDRDGILNEVIHRDGDIHSPRSWDEIKIFPEMKRLSEIKPLGFLLILMTNQPDIERGVVPKEFVTEVHEKFKQEFSLDAVFCCPFKSNEHADKKPNPGMFLKAKIEFNLDMSQSFHLGDTDRDVGAAKNAGCQSILWTRPYNEGFACDFRVQNFDDLKALLMTKGRGV
jgi:D-glycero-D-manno-heptose 1,7-bisphosphate phosphatase